MYIAVCVFVCGQTAFLTVHLLKIRYRIWLEDDQLTSYVNNKQVLIVKRHVCCGEQQFRQQCKRNSVSKSVSATALSVSAVFTKTGHT